MAQSRFLGSLHIVDHGGTGSTILLIHGLGGSHVNWSQVAPRLSDHGRTVAVDLPGFGRSGPARRHDLTTHTEAVRRTVDEFGSPATLVGNSMGGLVAMMVAAADSELADTLVLVAPAAPLPPRTPPPSVAIATQLVLQSLPGIGPVITDLYRTRLTPRRQVELALESITANLTSVAPDAIDDAVDLAEIRQTYPWVGRAFAESAASTARWILRPTKYATMVESIATPTLVISGDRDPVVSPAAMAELARRRPDWDSKVFAGVGHVPQLEMPSLFTRTVVEWLARMKNPGHS